MSFSFLAAGLLVLSGLVVGPLLAHLALQRPVDRRPFGAMMLLRRVELRLRRRRRVRDVLLMVLRMLAVLLAVLAVAGPELRTTEDAPPFGSSGRVVVILDNSLSMSMMESGGPGLTQELLGRPGAGTLLGRAREEAVQLVRHLPEGTLVGAVTTAVGSNPGGEGVGARRLVSSLSTDTQAVARVLEAVEPTFEGTDLAGALHQARALLGGLTGEVLVYGDEAGPGVVEAAAPEMEALLRQKVTVIPRLTRIDPPDNLAVMGATYGEGLEGGSLRASVIGYGTGLREAALTVTLPDSREMTAFVDTQGCAPQKPDEAMPVCDRAEEVFTVPPEVPGGVARVEVRDDNLRADNTRYFHLPRVGASRVLVVDGDPGPTPIQSEVYFLERALAPWGGLRTGVTPDVTAPAGISELDPQRHRVVFLANVANPKPLADRLSAFVRAGGGVVISAGENLSPDLYNSALANLLPVPLLKVRNLVALDAQGGMALLPPDPAEPLFQPFSLRGRSAFTKVSFRRIVTLDAYNDSEDVHTLLRLENGLPLMVERRIGKGRVVFFGGTFDYAWGNLPLQAVFMPFIQRMVGWLGGESGGGTARFEGTTGRVVDLALPEAVYSVDVLGPNGQAIPAQVDSGRVHFVPRIPGSYTVALPGAPPLAWVAVNTPPEESDLRRPLALAQLEAAIDPSLFLRRIDLAPWLLGAVLLLLAIQAMFGLMPRAEERGEPTAKSDGGSRAGQV